MMNIEQGYKISLLENIVTEMSSEEFEIYCLDLLRGMKNNLQEFSIGHNRIYVTNYGQYQLDGIIEFELFGLKYKTIVEYKKYKAKTKRSQIQILHDTMRSTGAQKGVFISISNFQKGAMDYEKYMV